MNINHQTLEADGLTFRFSGSAVGYFEGGTIPTSPGLYRYMPYRSIEHLRMQQQVQESGSARCSYEHDGIKISFSVLECPHHGLLRLDLFSDQES